MKKILITGISGFVGGHLTQYLAQERKDLAVYGISRSRPAWNFLDKGSFEKIIIHQVDLLDVKKVSSILKSIRPDYIVHLASFSSVADSWTQPGECFLNNTNIFLNIIESVRQNKVHCRILSIGSSEEYGSVLKKDLPLIEEKVLFPINPYAVARVAQEQLSRVFVSGYGLDIVCTRSFNHVGPAQADRFVVSSFIRQALEISEGKREFIACGDLDIVRDFIDVRDITRAYMCLLDHGACGDIYNVCSGQGILLKDVLRRICAQLNIESKYIVSPQLVRPADNPFIIGDNQKLRKLGFVPAYDLDRSLRDMISWWKQNSGSSGIIKGMGR